jgi:hypothetical protein
LIYIGSYYNHCWLPSEDASPETTGDSTTHSKDHGFIMVIENSTSTYLGLTIQAFKCEREKVRGGGKYFATYSSGD